MPSRPPWPARLRRGWQNFRGRPWVLSVYRLGLLTAIAWLVRDHHVRLRIAGDAPIQLNEAKAFFPGATHLRPDHSPRAGLHVLDAAGHPLGYLIRTAPHANDIIGYAGPTDTLVAFDPAWRILGLRIRSSEDTHTHVGDVASDTYFMGRWKQFHWEDLPDINYRKKGVEGVSGATMTSMGIADGIQHRIRLAEADLDRPRPFQPGWRDLGLLVVVTGAMALAFTRWRGNARVRLTYQIGVVAYVGFYSGDLLAQSLLTGWMRSAVPWRTAPGLVILAAAALIVPWGTRRALYCGQICPHGILQDWLGRMAPRRWRIQVPQKWDRPLRWIPPALLAGVLPVIFWALPLDLANLEPFDAYVWQRAGVATLVIAVAGLGLSLFVRQGYCHYGCPTGALLNFVRSHGGADHFGRRDAVAGLFLLLALLLYTQHDLYHHWLNGPHL